MDSQNDTWFVNDGAVDNETYSEQKVKILWVLRETNGKGFDFKKFLGNPKVYKKWKSTVGLVIKTSNAIFENSAEKDYNKYPMDISNLMKKIAWVNIKKTGGKARSNYKELYEHSKENSTLIENQIKELAPDIIILAGTKGLVSEKIKNDVSSLTRKNTSVISAYHTNQRKIKHKIYIRQIIEKIQVSPNMLL